ncbi:siderophore-interacting protein [Bradyrhizobium canariense]|uniref:CRISPR-associated protein Cas5, N-terminal domain-containing protein n=1 Tax=Bradyrhizobium canariense TaxID=255045 RepID=A0A1H1MBG4_9BRAD|nr:siderophore-interacting protein [Bradyrhizobium canariense]SDR84184.1 CRISPR-associated protein Cas5, N-terminal domain-containing protein [Bradyrhizobium canariense]
MPAESVKGRLGGVLRRILMRRATVFACKPIAGRFRLISLEGPALRGAVWAPGQKVQIAMAAPFVTRTYTPIEWEASTGRTRILCYAHGVGPGSAWVRDVKPGDECDVFGPRGSIDVRPASGPLAVFGDETSIGLAYALSAHHPTRSAALHFELDDMEAGRHVLKHMDLSGAALFGKRTDDAHVEQMAAALPSLAATGASFVFAGKAGTVQRLRQSLKQLEVTTPRISTKAYWAPGKVGLD